MRGILRKPNLFETLNTVEVMFYTLFSKIISFEVCVVEASDSDASWDRYYDWLIWRDHLTIISSEARFVSEKL